MNDQFSELGFFWRDPVFAGKSAELLLIHRLAVEFIMVEIGACE